MKVSFLYSALLPDVEWQVSSLRCVINLFRKNKIDICKIFKLLTELAGEESLEVTPF